MRVVAGAGQPIMKRFIAPSLGTSVIDQSTYLSTTFYVDTISTTTKAAVRVVPVKVLTVLTACMRHCLIQDFVTHRPKMLPVSEIDRLCETLLSHT
jgi:hypothetical protein